MPELRAATPADARKVWESFEHNRQTPSIRTVVRAMNASGAFHHVNTSTVGRWKKAAWVPTTPGSKPPLKKAKADVSAAVPALTGDPQTRTEDLTGQAERIAAERKELGDLTDDKLLTLASREALITTVMLMRRVQDIADKVETMPKEIGVLQKALAGSLTAGTGGFAQLLDIHDRLMKLVQNEADVLPERGHDPLSSALDAYGKAAHEHG